MNRRNFLKTAAGGAVALAAAGMAAPAMGRELRGAELLRQPPGQQHASARPAGTASHSNQGHGSKLRGVNLGAWLVLEKWMVPDVYRGTDAPDEYSLCLALGSAAKDRLARHRDTFITEDDFLWIKNRGLNAVRLPVGYWALEAPAPYVEASSYIDFALEQCRQNDLKLLLDLHGAPGSQNGWDHSGRMGPINWPKDPQNIQETLRVLESFAQRYGKHPALYGIELLNEPRNTVPLDILQQFYRDAFMRLRPQLDPKIAIVFHDSFRPLVWKNFMQGPEFTNVILDTHLYQCFDEAARFRTASEQLTFALNRKGTLDEMQREELPTMVGEWSLSLPGKTMSGLSAFQIESVTRGYADTQLLSYEGTRGWFFWSYKMQHNSEWNFRHCVDRGWLPGDYAV